MPQKSPPGIEGTFVAPPAGRALVRFDWLLVLPPAVALLLFAAAGDNFGFDPPGWLDAFTYLGYFWHYPEHLPIFEDYYKSSRLPWVLSGFAIHNVFGEIAGSYVLHWSTLSFGGVALYLLLRDTVRDRAIAAVLAVAWVCSSQGHGPGGWNYHVAAAASYYLFACWLTVRAATGKSRGVLAVLAGAALACAIHTHLLLVLFVPLVVALYVAAAPAGLRSGWPRLARDLGFGVGGALLLTLLLALINVTSGGAWLFFAAQVNYALWIAQPGNNDAWWHATGEWLPRARHLVLPVAALFVTTILAIRSGRRHAFARTFVWHGWIALGIYAYYQFVKQQSVLDHDYISFAVYCYAFPALSVLMLKRAGTPGSRGGDGATLAVAVALPPVALLLATPALTAATLQRIEPILGGGIAPVLPVTIAAIAILGVVAALPRRPAIMAFATAFSIINVWVVLHPGQYGLKNPGMQRDMLRLFREADRFTTALDPTLDNIDYWFTAEQVQTRIGKVNLSDVFNSYVSTRLWLPNLLGAQGPVPSLEEIKPEHVQNVICVGVLSSIDGHESLRAEFSERLREAGQPIVPVAGRRFESPALSFALTVYRAGRPESSGTVGDSPAGCRP